MLSIVIFFLSCEISTAEYFLLFHGQYSMVSIQLHLPTVVVLLLIDIFLVKLLAYII